MQPDAARRTQFSETGEDVADCGAHGFIGMEAHLAVLFAPDEADGETATQFAARGFVANAAEQAATQNMQFGFAHRALETEQEPVVESRRVNRFRRRRQ